MTLNQPVGDICVNLIGYGQRKLSLDLLFVHMFLAGENSNKMAAATTAPSMILEKELPSSMVKGRGDCNFFYYIWDQ